MQTKIKIIDTYFGDLTNGKVYNAVYKKGGLWIENDWDFKIEIDLHTEANKELIKYEIVK